MNALSTGTEAPYFSGTDQNVILRTVILRTKVDFGFQYSFLL